MSEYNSKTVLLHQVQILLQEGLVVLHQKRDLSKRILKDLDSHALDLFSAVLQGNFRQEHQSTP